MFTDRLGPLRDRLEDVEERLAHLEAVFGDIDDRIRTIIRGEDGLAASGRVAELEKRLEETRQAVAHGIEDVERRENRIRSTVGRALKVLDEHGFDPTPGLEAEARGLQLVDGDGGEDEGVRPVPEDVEASQAALRASLEGIPGEFSAEDLETVRRRRAHSA